MPPEKVRQRHRALHLELTMEDVPAREDVEALRAGLSEHAARFVEGRGFEPLAVFARDPAGELVGGAYGFVNWTWLDASLLWVAPAHGGRGLGSRLLRTLEASARERGCEQAHLETFSYQARGFYERHGYRAFAELPDYPPGHARIYMRKRLREEPEEEGI